MAVRARLVISGNVQDVGYRTLIRKVANKMKVNGIVRNLEDGNVEVYCECANKEIVTKFCKNIEKKSSTEDMFILNVESIKIYEEGSKEYGDPKTDFKVFKIDYGMEIDPFQKATLTRSEVGILLLGGTKSGIGIMTEKQDGMNAKLDNISNQLGGALTRYDAIGQKVNTMESDIKELTKQITRLVDHMVEKDKT
ncbi:MAG: acylphosphatase [Euryarchaeota archaeon]|nr:acylphosphatase [Euryarchaeota archaeon]